MFYRRGTVSFKGLCLFLCLIFAATLILSDLFKLKKSEAQILGLPEPSQMVEISKDFSLPLLKGLKLNADNPLQIDFYVDTADKRNVTEKETAELINYFLAGLVIPAEDLWVNLSPYEQDRIIPDSLGVTEAGNGLLAQDYILKQLSSSLTHPDSEIGANYWKSLSSNVDSNISVAQESFNKIWVVPGKAGIFENGNSVFVTKANLKVKTELDYLAQQKNKSTVAKDKTQTATDLLIPEITDDVNNGKNFAKLRQIYYSLVLATWFKQKFKDSFYRYYIDSNNSADFQLEDKSAKDKIYALYCESFKKGVYDLLKTEKSNDSNSKHKKHYFSGGYGLMEISSSMENVDADEILKSVAGQMIGVSGDISLDSKKKEDIYKEISKAKFKVPYKDQEIAWPSEPKSDGIDGLSQWVDYCKSLTDIFSFLDKSGAASFDKHGNKMFSSLGEVLMHHLGTAMQLFRFLVERDGREKFSVEIADHAVEKLDVTLNIFDTIESDVENGKIATLTEAIKKYDKLLESGGSIPYQAKGGYFPYKSFIDDKYPKTRLRVFKETRKRLKIAAKEIKKIADAQKNKATTESSSSLENESNNKFIKNNGNKVPKKIVIDPKYLPRVISGHEQNALSYKYLLPGTLFAMLQTVPAKLPTSVLTIEAIAIKFIFTAGVALSTRIFLNDIERYPNGIKDLVRHYLNEVYDEQSLETDLIETKLENGIYIEKPIKMEPKALQFDWRGNVVIYFKEPHLKRLLAPIIFPIPTWISPLEDWTPLSDKLRSKFKSLKYAVSQRIPSLNPGTSQLMPEQNNKSKVSSSAMVANVGVDLYFKFLQEMVDTENYYYEDIDFEIESYKTKVAKWRKALGEELVEKAEVLLVVGPSGSGKSEFIDALREAEKSVQQVKLVTTRQLRDGEENGKEKFFVSQEEFKEKQQNETLFFDRKSHGENYGVDINWFSDQVNDGKVMVFDITTPKSFLMVKDMFPHSRSVMLSHKAINKINEIPTEEIHNFYKKRFAKRNLRPEEEAKRINENTISTKWYAKHSDLFDTVVVNPAEGPVQRNKFTDLAAIGIARRFHDFIKYGNTGSQKQISSSMEQYSGLNGEDLFKAYFTDQLVSDDFSLIDAEDYAAIDKKFSDLYELIFADKEFIEMEVEDKELRGLIILLNQRAFESGAISENLDTEDLEDVDDILNSIDITKLNNLDAGDSSSSALVALASTSDIVFEVEHPYPRWFKIDKNGEPTSALVDHVFESREVYADADSWENNIDMFSFIDKAVRKKATIIMWSPLGPRSQYDARKSFENAEEYASQLDRYLAGEVESFEFIKDDSPYSSLSPYLVDRRYITTRLITDIPGQTLEEKYNYYALEFPSKLERIVSEIETMPEMVEGVEALALRILRDGRKEYLDFVIENFPEYRASPFVKMSNDQIRETGIYKKLIPFLLFEQHWGMKQIKDVVDYAESKGIPVGLDIPAYPSIIGVESVHHPEMLLRRDDGSLVVPGNDDQPWSSLATPDRNGYYRKHNYDPILDPYRWWANKFGIKGFRGDAWHHSKAADGCWEIVSKFMRDNDLLFTVETAGAFDAPEINPYSRSLGGINLEIPWENESQGRINTLGNLVNEDSEHGFQQNNQHTTIMLTAVHDFLNVPSKYRNLFGGIDDNEIITKGILGLFAMASNAWGIAHGNDKASDWSINDRPGAEMPWPGGSEETGVDLVDYIGRLSQIRMDHPFMLNPRKMAISTIAPGIVQVERYSKGGKRAVVSVHNISGETKQGWFKVDYGHFKIDQTKPFALKDLLTEDAQEYTFSKESGTLSEDDEMFYKLKPGQAHVFYLDPKKDYSVSSAIKVRGDRTHRLSSNRGFGWLDMASPVWKSRIETALRAQGFKEPYLAWVADAIARIKTGSLEKRRIIFFTPQDYSNIILHIDIKAQDLLKKLQAEELKFKQAGLSQIQREELVYKKLIPYSWYEKFQEEGASHNEIMEFLINIDNPVGMWESSLKYALNFMGADIEKEQAISLILRYRTDMNKKFWLDKLKPFIDATIFFHDIKGTNKEKLSKAISQTLDNDISIAVINRFNDEKLDESEASILDAYITAVGVKPRKQYINEFNEDEVVVDDMLEQFKQFHIRAMQANLILVSLREKVKSAEMKEHFSKKLEKYLQEIQVLVGDLKVYISYLATADNGLANLIGDSFKQDDVASKFDYANEYAQPLFSDIEMYDLAKTTGMFDKAKEFLDRTAKLQVRETTEFLPLVIDILESMKGKSLQEIGDTMPLKSIGSGEDSTVIVDIKKFLLNSKKTSSSMEAAKGGMDFNNITLEVSSSGLPIELPGLDIKSTDKFSFNIISMKEIKDIDKELMNVQS